MIYFCDIVRWVYLQLSAIVISQLLLLTSTWREREREGRRDREEKEGEGVKEESEVGW